MLQYRRSAVGYVTTVLGARSSTGAPEVVASHSFAVKRRVSDNRRTSDAMRSLGCSYGL